MLWDVSRQADEVTKAGALEEEEEEDEEGYRGSQLGTIPSPAYYETE